MKPTQNIYRVIESFNYLTDDIERPLDKGWLKPALISHIKNELDMPEEFIKKAIELIYLSADF